MYNLINSAGLSTSADSMIDLLQRVHSLFTITLNDDGKFAARTKVAEAINVNIDFDKPDASYQLGTNENTNGIIGRR